MGPVDGLQGVVGRLGLPQGLQPLLPQRVRHPAGKAEAGLAALEVGLGHHGVQPHPAVGGAVEGHPLPAGDEGQLQLRQQQVLDAVHVLRVGADHGGVPSGPGGGVEALQHGRRQTVGVLQLVDSGAQRRRRVKAPDGPPARQASQKPEPVGPSCPLSTDLPADDAVRAVEQPARVQPLQHQGGGAVVHLPGGPQGVVGPLVGGGDGPAAGNDLPPRGLGGGDVVKLSQVHIAVHGGGILGLHHVGRGAVHHRRADARYMYPVQRRRVPGAVEVLHLLPPLLHGRTDPAHHRGLPHAGSPLEHQQVVVVLRYAEAVKQALEPPAAVCPQEKMCCLHDGHSSQLIGFSFHNMRQTPAGDWRSPLTNSMPPHTMGAPPERSPPL